MPTPRKGYFLKDGTPVPGTTTICGAYKESGGLIHWAWTEGKAGRDYKESRDRAGSIGTAAHAMIEAHIRGEQPEPSPIPEVNRAFGAYLAWLDNNQIKIIENEIQLVSHEYRYGGTPDAVGLVNGKLVLLDWKTSKSVYKTHILQLAAYKALLDENSRPPVTRAYLVRFSKTDAAFELYEFGVDALGIGWEQFKLFRKAYDLEDRLDTILEGARSCKVCMKPPSQ